MQDVLISKLANLRSMASWRLPKPDVETLDEVIGVLAALNSVEAIHTAPPKAVPLTRAQVNGLLESAGYYMASPQENADFINGIRHAEMAHGITPATVEKEGE